MNRLAHETSPYLQQHASNPVDWHPWGDEALALARREDKPILLSIGYAACHWCHVMAHESFEREETARVMNELFVNIKVDREERPDLDGIYMSAVQAMTGHGGWPLTVFLTPDGVPFYGGTYYPPDDRHGMPAFTRVLRSVAEAYRTRRGDVERTAEEVRRLYAHARAAARRTGALEPALLDRAARAIAARHDAARGGFEGAPKFPQAMALDFLLRHWRRTGAGEGVEIALGSFRAMARGGIHDQVGGGFHRYAVDAEWRVPHFEKMLYDNALLARLGAHLFQATHDDEVRVVTEGAIEWVAREMTSPGGGFYSSLDADSEGREGAFYVWDEREMDALLGPDAAAAEAYWGVTAAGNFEGHNVLHVPYPMREAAERLGVETAELENTIARSRRTLYAARAARPHPGRDEKVLAAWNGLMLRAVADAARVFGREDFRALALANGAFLFREMVQDGRVRRSYKDGVARPSGYLEDHAAVALGALALHELTFDAVWLARARELAGSMLDWFWDDEAGAFFDTPRDAEALIARPREVTDNATPSGTSLAVELLLRLAELLQDDDLRRRATWVLETLAEPMGRWPSAFGHMLGNADLAVHGAVEVALVGDPAARDFRALDREVAAHYLPALVLAGGPPREGGAVPLLAGREALGGVATAYVCRRYVCDAPVTDREALGAQLERSSRAERGA
ncbi:MAG TPA: thioredoxin domain-containing protein [Gemmatimonadaceae bacterium]